MSRVIGYKAARQPSVAEAFGASGAPAAPDQVQDDNKYLDKLVKYVPAEVTAIAAGLFATFDLKDAGLWAAFLALAAINIVYLMVNAKQTKTVPEWYFYALSTVAFGAWSVATVPDIADAFGLAAEEQRAYILAAAAVLIPLCDQGMGLIFDRDKRTADTTTH